MLAQAPFSKRYTQSSQSGILRGKPKRAAQHTALSLQGIITILFLPYTTYGKRADVTSARQDLKKNNAHSKNA